MEKEKRGLIKLLFPPRVSTEKSDRDKITAGNVRSRNTILISKLEDLKPVDRTGTIQPETMEECERIIKMLIDNLENSPVIVSDTKRIDDYLVELIGYLNDAFSHGNIATVKEILEMLSNGINDSRATLDRADEYEKTKRISILERQSALAGMLVICDEISEELQKVDALLSDKITEFTDLSKGFKSYSQDHPELIEEEKRYIGRSDPMPAEILSYSTMKKRVVEAYNYVKRLKEIKAINEISLQSRKAAVNNIRQQMLSISSAMDPKILERMKKIQQETEEELLKVRQSNREIDDIVGKFESIMEAVFSDPSLADHVVKTNMEFESVLAEVKRKEEQSKRVVNVDRLAELDNTEPVQNKKILTN